MISIPIRSQAALFGIDLSTFDPLQDRINVYAKYDSEHEDGDPSRVEFIGKLKSGVVIWCAKLAIDADGVPKDHFQGRTGKQLDPASGQNDTSLHVDGDPLSSEAHPYYVIPGGSFRIQSGLQLGDICAVIFNGCITGAVFGDVGPWDKIGEGSIFLHEGLSAGGAPDPCVHRDSNGNCVRIRNSSIPRDVIVIGFPNSKIDLKWDTLADQVRQEAYRLFSSIGGSLP